MNLYYPEWTLKSGFLPTTALPSKKVPSPSKILDPPLIRSPGLGYIQRFEREFFYLLDGVSNCMDNSDEENCNEEKCNLNKHVYCPREKKCARRENSYRYYLNRIKNN